MAAAMSAFVASSSWSAPAAVRSCAARTSACGARKRDDSALAGRPACAGIANLPRVATLPRGGPWGLVVALGGGRVAVPGELLHAGERRARARRSPSPSARTRPSSSTPRSMRASPEARDEAMPTLHPEERIWLDEYRRALVEQQPGAVARLLVWIEKSFSFSRLCVPYGGGGGIRTHGASRLAGFQDRCFRPLSHPTIPGHPRFGPRLAGRFRRRRGRRHVRCARAGGEHTAGVERHETRPHFAKARASPEKSPAPVIETSGSRSMIRRRPIRIRRRRNVPIRRYSLDKSGG